MDESEKKHRYAFWLGVATMFFAENADAPGDDVAATLAKAERIENLIKLLQRAEDRGLEMAATRLESKGRIDRASWILAEAIRKLKAVDT